MSLNLVSTIENAYGATTHNIRDAAVQGWSTHYGENGGGFGYLRFSVKRPVGYDYHDIGYGNEITLYKRLGQVLFHGMIRNIDERSSSKGDEIMVTALGWAVVADDDELHQHYCDTRLARWKPRYGEIPKTNYRPDLYTTGFNNVGLFMHCNNNASYSLDNLLEQMVMIYEFNEETDDTVLSVYELGHRIQCDLDLVLGAGVAFDGDIIYGLFEAAINTVDDGTDTVVYKDDVNEDTVIDGDTLYNATQEESYTITTITQASNTIVLSGSPDLSGWGTEDQLEILEGRFEYGNTNNHAFLQSGMKISNLTQGKEATIANVDKVNYLIQTNTRAGILGWETGDEVFMPGPIFWADILSVASDEVEYENMVGLDNLQTDWPIVNMTKKSIAHVASVDLPGATITVSDAEDVEKWETSDLIMQPVMFFFAQCDGVPAGATLTYKGEIGERLVENDSGWVLYNETQEEFATVASWDTASSQLDVTSSGDVSAWVDNDVLRIYTPFRVSIKRDDGSAVWPLTDWREGAIMQRGTSISLSHSLGTDHYRIYLENFIAGTANETTIAQFKNLRVYNSYYYLPTPEGLAVDMINVLGNATNGHGLSDEIWDIDSTLDNEIEPMYFEYNTPREALTWVCGFGDGASPPAKTAWGIRLNTDRRLYLERQDLETIEYYILRGGESEVQSGGTVDESVQRIQGLYTDPLGNEQLTSWYEDADSYFNGQWRRKRVRLETVDNPTEAAIALELYLAENKGEKRNATYRVSEGSVFTRGWLPVSFDEMQATGKLIKIQDRRVKDMGEFGSGDARDSWITEQLAAVEVDYQNQSVSIIPSSAKDSFESYMAVLSRINTR